METLLKFYISHLLLGLSVGLGLGQCKHTIGMLNFDGQNVCATHFVFVKL